MQVKKLTLQRLMKQEASIQKEPIPNAIVVRQDILKFYFCLYNLQGSYAEGFYFGLLQLHQNYPFNAPKLIFYTPSGRFETNLPICTSFTNYHQQSWTSAWNIRTLILATISFMYSEQPSYGCCHNSHQQRVKMAKESLQFNMNNEQFVRLFEQKLKSLNLLDQSKYQKLAVQNVVVQAEKQQEEVNEEPEIVREQLELPNEVVQQFPQIRRRENKRRPTLSQFASIVIIAGGLFFVAKKYL